MLLVLLLAPLPAQAYDLINLQQAASLTLHVTDGAQPLASVPFDIYRVARIDRTGRYTLTADFAATGLSINAGDDAGRWQHNLDALVAHAPNAQPVYTLSTDAKGLITLPKLEKGLYLALGRKTQVGSYMYSFIPALVSLPTPQNDHWLYRVDAEIKKEKQQTRIDLTALKVWKDKGYRSTRSASVVIELLQDGVCVQTVTLNELNGWKHVFEGLDNRFEYTLRERDVPSGYQASYVRSGDTITVTNTLTDIPSSGGGSGGMLPQTGLVWWPACALAAAGLALLLLAFRSGGRGRIVWLLLAAALLAGAACRMLNHLREENEAGAHAQTVLEQLAPAAPEGGAEPVPAAQTGEKPSETPILLPAFERFPDMEMPVNVVDGESYIGTVEIPSLGLRLPVISECSDPRLKKAPCRYSGSAYAEDLVIAGHNYQTHFGTLRQLQPGEEVLFTDAEGNVFRYEAAAMEQLKPRQVEEMTRSGYPLTLFTCAPGGRSRIAVRCALQGVTYAGERIKNQKTP